MTTQTDETAPDADNAALADALSVLMVRAFMEPQTPLHRLGVEERERLSIAAGIVARAANRLQWLVEQEDRT